MLKLIDNDPQPAIKTAQNITTSWADLGEVMNLGDVEILNLWINLDVNGAADVQFRIVPMKSATATDFYSTPIAAATSTTVKITPENFTLDNDVDQKIMIPFTLSGVIPYGKIQVQAGTAGTGQILNADVTCKRVRR